MEETSGLLILAGVVLLAAAVASRLVRAWGELAEARRRRPSERRGPAATLTPAEPL